MGQHSFWFTIVKKQRRQAGDAPVSLAIRILIHDAMKECNDAGMSIKKCNYQV